MLRNKKSPIGNNFLMMRKDFFCKWEEVFCSLVKNKKAGPEKEPCQTQHEKDAMFYNQN